jgi:integrase
MSTLREYADTWLETVKPTIRPNTYRAYEQALRLRVLPDLGDTPLSDLNRPQLKVWFVRLLGQFKSSTAGHAVVTIHALLQSAVEDEVLPKNPATGLRRALRGVSKSRTRRPPLTREQLSALLEAARRDPDTYPHVVLLAYTGLRAGEAIGLQWGDVDFSKRTIRIERQVHQYGEVAPVKTVTGSGVIPMASQLSRVLWMVRTQREMLEEKWRVPHSPWILFPDLNDGTSGNSARKILTGCVKRALKRAGLPMTFSPHSLRHTVATLLLEEGVDLKFIQNLLRHSSISITADTYGHAAKMREGVVDLLDKAVNGTNGPRRDEESC